MEYYPSVIECEKSLWKGWYLQGAGIFTVLRVGELTFALHCTVLCCLFCNWDHYMELDSDNTQKYEADGARRGVFFEHLF